MRGREIQTVYRTCINGALWWEMEPARGCQRKGGERRLKEKTNFVKKRNIFNVRNAEWSNLKSILIKIDGI